MEKKICKKCKIEKELDDFHRYKSSKDGRKNICKLCFSDKNKTEEERVKNRLRNKKRITQNPQKNKEKRLEYYFRYYNKNKENVLKRNKEWKENNIEKYNKAFKEWCEKNKEKILNDKKEYREKNKDKVLNATRKWVNENYEYYLLKKREYSKSQQGLLKKRENYHKNKEKNNHIIAWRKILHNTIRRIGGKKENETSELLGYSPIQLKECIERKFVDGMSWDNWGEWHIDHIKPVSSFDKSEKICIINSLDNLQPLWAKDNLTKSNKIINI